jgi:predicted nuclease of predicted toxin-antitoxin system
MRFLIDRCTGTLIATWLRGLGHDVVESRDLGSDPGDQALLEWAAQQSRILITIDTDFGQLVFLQGQSHSGLVRLPDVPSSERVAIMKDVIERFQTELESGAIITVRGGKIRISQSPSERTKPQG